MATTAQWGSHTYMLRDAVEGKIIGIPDTIVNEVEVTANVWECTRLVVSSQIDNAEQRSAVLPLIVKGLVDQARAQGGTELMSLSPPSLQRALRKFGYDPRMIGEPYVNADDGRRYVALSMPVTQRNATPETAQQKSVAPAPVASREQVSANAMT